MKHIAIVTPGILPVPAISGGAVEELITKLIAGNEINPQVHMDIYTIADNQLDGLQYQYANICQIKKPYLVKIIDKMMDKLLRISHGKESCRIYDKYMTAQIIKKKYDLIIIENMTSLYRTIRRSYPKVKMFFHMHNGIDAYRAIQDFKTMSFNGDGVLVVSNYLKNYLKGEIPSLSCKTLWNSVNRTWFCPITENKRSTARERFKLEQDKFIFLYAGRMIPEKGVLELFQAFQHIREKYAQAALVVVGKALFEKKGETSYYRHLRELAAQTPDIVFTGFLLPEDMPLAYACADMVVVPSKWQEPFGMVALEAMSMGIPQIVTRVGGLPEVVDESCALLIAADDCLEDNLIKAMEKALKIGNMELQRMSKAALTRMEQHPEFDEKNYFEEFCQYIK
ncbi:MAG: glycosyltransferase family 4 protein [Lachnospiraceae bacterium]|nr:glycosyltransferase family 4 protein [Lachnospiraceae bacterium]